MNPKAQDWALLLLRVVAGLVILYYGSQKMLGVFGGMGFQATVSTFQKMGIPPVLGVLAIVGEFFGALGLLAGMFGRVAAFGVFSTMMVATFMELKQTTTIVMTQGNDPFRAFAYPLLIGTIALAIVIMGSGELSLDRKFFGSKRK